MDDPLFVFAQYRHRFDIFCLGICNLAGAFLSNKHLVQNYYAKLIKMSSFLSYSCYVLKYAYSIKSHLLASLEHCRVFSSNSNSWKKPCPTVVVRSRAQVPVLVVLCYTIRQDRSGVVAQGG